MPFPLTSPPSYYCTCTTPSRNNIFYVGGSAPSITLSQATPDAYEVLDYDGNVVSSGAVSGTSVTPTAPVGGWDPGWYRVYFTGPNTDATYGDSYGATNFVVLRNDSRFPPNATITGSGQGGGEARDMIMKGILGMAPTRLQIEDAAAPTSGFDNIATCQVSAGYGNDYWADSTHGAYVEPDRPERLLMLQFPNRTYDRIAYAGGIPGFRVYVKTPAVNGAQVFMQVEAGSVSGAKYTVRFPNSSTIVETYDNVGNADTFVSDSASSAYIKAFGAGANPSPTGPEAIGAAHRDGVIATVVALSAGPYNVMRYEGPINEAQLDAELAHRMRLFQDAVHTGNASAKAIGPCPVEINDDQLDLWENFLVAGGGTYCDEISFHAYNSQTNGDINLGRHVIEGFLDKLAEHGQDSKALWNTESTHVFSSVYGVYHPRRSRVPLLVTLLWEQYGLPRERNHVWYDRSHGFWAYPAFLANADITLNSGSLNPYAVLYRVLAEETFNMPHSQSLDFGNATANAIFLGLRVPDAERGRVLCARKSVVHSERERDADRHRHLEPAYRRGRIRERDDAEHRERAGDDSRPGYPDLRSTPYWSVRICLLRERLGRVYAGERLVSSHDQDARNAHCRRRLHDELRNGHRDVFFEFGASRGGNPAV